MNDQRPRVLWLAGTRGEILRLAPYALHAASEDSSSDRLHWFASTGEQGTAAVQALDTCRLRPHAEVELRHPAEDPAIRLHGLLGEVESLARRFRATHLVFTGVGPTAAASALACHGRQLQGIWISPRDEAGLIPRLRWERGLESIIRSLKECVREIEPGPVSLGEASGGVAEASGPGIAGRRSDAPLAMIAVARPAWGSTSLPESLARAVVRWAKSSPEADWCFLRSLDARFEGPLQAIESLPPNLLTPPPVPYEVYASVLRSARVILTDSWAMASEGLAMGAGVACLGEVPRMSASEHARLHSITLAEIETGDLEAWLTAALIEPVRASGRPLLWDFRDDLAAELKVALSPT